jgi:hypothetical protein
MFFSGVHLQIWKYTLFPMENGSKIRGKMWGKKSGMVLTITSGKQKGG